MLQYPYEQHEGNLYYSGYDNEVHQLPAGGESYTGYSIWVNDLSANYITLKNSFVTIPFQGYISRGVGVANTFCP